MVLSKTRNDRYLEYIGMTSYKFKDYVKEHLGDLKHNWPATTLLRLKKKQNIEVNLEEAKIIFPLKIILYNNEITSEVKACKSV